MEFYKRPLAEREEIEAEAMRLVDKIIKFENLVTEFYNKRFKISKNHKKAQVTRKKLWRFLKKHNMDIRKYKYCCNI